MNVLLNYTLPGPRFLDEVVVATWIDATHYEGPVACTLLGHPEARPTESPTDIETAVTYIATGLGLARGALRLPARRRLIHRRPGWALDYGHPDCDMLMPDPGTEWGVTARTSGGCIVVVSLDPLLPGADPRPHYRQILESRRYYSGYCSLANP